MPSIVWHLASHFSDFCARVVVEPPAMGFTNFLQRISATGGNLSVASGEAIRGAAF
ncbi:MAG: hypothetical protein HC925_03915 [Coleofasciculaceae cyanobacterium SM2_3_26]|nr:hypothetical protein [Coleofasciculaceae cyanobacterium SM2_3_26]